MVLNFEARGTHGPSIMFQTSDANGWLVREFAKSDDYPVANSLSSDLYKLLPNDTDFTVFRDAGLVGLNFAFIEGASSYHSSLDNSQNLDQRSLQHHGLQALALTRHFGNLDLRGPVRSGDVVYFDLWGRGLLRYSMAVAITLAATITLFIIAAIVLGYRCRFLKFSGLALGMAALLLSVTSAAGLVWLAWRMIVVIHGSPTPLPYQDTSVNRLYLAGFVALSIASASAIYAWFRKKISIDELALGSLLWFWALMIMLIVYLPGGSYLVTWPLLFGVVGWIYRFTQTRRELSRLELSLIFFPSAAAGIILLVPLIFQLFVAFVMHLVYGVAALAALLLGLLAAQFDLVTGARKWLLPGISAAVALGIILAALFQSDFGRRRPQTDDLFYALNADTGRAIWVSPDEQPDEWTSQFLTKDAHQAPVNDYLPWLDSGEFLQSPAPAYRRICAFRRRRFKADSARPRPCACTGPTTSSATVSSSVSAREPIAPTPPNSPSAVT